MHNAKPIFPGILQGLLCLPWSAPVCGAPPVSTLRRL